MYPLPIGTVSELLSSSSIMTLNNSSAVGLQRGPNGLMPMFSAFVPSEGNESFPPRWDVNSGAAGIMLSMHAVLNTRPYKHSASASERQALRGEAKAPSAMPYWKA